MVLCINICMHLKALIKMLGWGGSRGRGVAVVHVKNSLEFRRFSCCGLTAGYISMWDNQKENDGKCKDTRQTDQHDDDEKMAVVCLRSPVERSRQRKVTPWML